MSTRAAEDNEAASDAVKVGRQIRRAREAKGMTQLELADAVEHKQSGVSGWENGHRIPNGLMLGRLADALDVTVDSLLGRH